MNTKKKIIESLEGKRTEQIWDLIEKSYLEVYEDTKKEELEIARKEYLEWEDNVNNEEMRYILVEHYNLYEGICCKFYHNGHKFEDMFEDYFDGSDGWEEILIVDMQEKKCYLVDKEVKYPTKLIKLK